MFDKVERNCAYCRRGHMLMNEQHVACKVFGITEPRFNCRRFAYDPLKRIPTQQDAPVEFCVEDFSIEA